MSRDSLAMRYEYLMRRAFQCGRHGVAGANADIFRRLNHAEELYRTEKENERNGRPKQWLKSSDELYYEYGSICAEVAAGGPLGASGAGLADLLAGRDTSQAALHRNPQPQVAEGVWLGARQEVHAMMDLSDGLASDIRHILDRSGVGAEIALERIPVATGADLRTAACAGEDYKLLLTAAPDAATRLATEFRERFGAPLYPIGRITAARGLVWLKNGKPEPLDWHGFTHY